MTRGLAAIARIALAAPGSGAGFVPEQVARGLEKYTAAAKAANIKND